MQTLALINDIVYFFVSLKIVIYYELALGLMLLSKLIVVSIQINRSDYILVLNLNSIQTQTLNHKNIYYQLVFLNIALDTSVIGIYFQLFRGVYYFYVF